LAEAGAPYAVGYGRPPKHTRFKPGQSGNPSGRRRKPLSLAREFFEVLHEPVTLGEGEACETVAKQRAILRALAAKAMEGDPRAIAKAIQLTQWITGFVPNYHVVAPVGWPKDEPEDEPEDESGDEPE
jgi:hypothetical protein